MVEAEDSGEPACEFENVCEDSDGDGSDDTAGASGLFVGSPLGTAIFAGAAAGAVGFLAPALGVTV